MKPLELTVYEKHPNADDIYRVGGFHSPYCLVSADKRFSDAELAAEFWQVAYVNERGADLDEQEDILYRFCTLPNYDEADQ